jgi:serine/threonine protein kinase
VIGRTINNYEVRALIAEGGMGAVYRAEHPFLKRQAAIKFLRGSLADDEAIVARFMNEARAANAIRHPNIIDVIDVGRLPDGPPYLMMELLEGETVAGRLQRMGRLSVAEACEIAREAAAGLAAAHQAGIVHLDLKPDNLFLARDATSWRGERTKILDFGIAKLHPQLTGTSPQSGGCFAGTPAYMAPEQCRGDGGELDPRADVYALGTVLYHMLCGAPPFVDEAQLEVFVMHVVQPPVPPRQHNPEIPAGLEAAILRALAKDPAERFASMTELRDALAPGGSTTPTVLLPRKVVARVVARRPWLMHAGLGAAVLFAGGLIWSARRGPPPAPVAVTRKIKHHPALVATPTPARPRVALAPERIDPPSALRPLPPGQPTPRHGARRRAGDPLRRHAGNKAQPRQSGQRRQGWQGWMEKW